MTNQVDKKIKEYLEKSKLVDRTNKEIFRIHDNFITVHSLKFDNSDNLFIYYELNFENQIIKFIPSKLNTLINFIRSYDYSSSLSY